MQVSSESKQVTHPAAEIQRHLMNNLRVVMMVKVWEDCFFQVTSSPEAVSSLNAGFTQGCLW